MRLSSLVGGFSLVELLTALGVVGVLAALIMPFVNSCFVKARMAKEIAGARSAITAWHAYASENNGSLLPGYLDFAAAQQSGVRNPAGQPLSFPVNARYVFRLAPYLDYQLKGSLLLNKQERLNSDYEMSLAPSFGINLTFVGGDYGSGSDKIPSEQNFVTYGKFAVTHLNEIYAPSKLLVFASARITDAALGNQEGYNAIKSPYFVSRRWAEEYDENRPYYDYGGVHPRFNGKAVCAMADGHVEALTMEQLEDMRRWSNQAAQADNPDWTLQTF